MRYTAISPSLSLARHRVIRHALAQLHPSSPDSALKSGEMQLYSYFTPGISTGFYDIIAEQTISTSDGSESKIITAPPQSFLVDALKYSIDPALIHSTFPLQGLAAQANILPHVVFNDPHLPWQTEIGKTSQTDKLRIPWLAVVAFEQSELKLQPDDPVFPPSLQGDANPKQSFTMATRLTVSQLTDSGFRCALPDLSTQILDDSSIPSKLVDVIFPDMTLFLALFTNTVNNTVQIDLDRFKYLAHVRQVNTTHMTDSAFLDGGEFSIVFSHRTGPPFENAAPLQPKRCVAHLVSLDWINNFQSDDLTSESNNRAALISLFSWTYDCIPPETVNFQDTMRKVGLNSGLYRTPDEIRNKVNQGSLSSAVQDRIKDRLKDGYTLLRYRVQTGEETVALMRGPLTPYQLPETSWFDIHSESGEDLQIIDTQLGLMDISYCAAWQLGKSLAIADQAFCAAIIRIRANVSDAAVEKAKQDIISQEFEVATSERVIGSLPQHFTDMTQLSKESENEKRWNRPSLIQSRYKLLAEQKNSETYRQSVDRHLRHQVKHIASATDGTHYTEIKDPQFPDWHLVLNWILDKIYLEKVPPWYLIPDPSWIPAESIRFFYVDHKWLSALVDGALSVANHLDAQDKVRQRIKDQLMRYLNEEFHPLLKYPPQVPLYGFFFRSVVVHAFPDLVIRASLPLHNNGQPAEIQPAEILRQENVRKDLLFCLLDRSPNSQNLPELVFSQPPHQQCFMFGHDSTFTTDGFDLELKQVYTVNTKPMEEFPKESFSKGSDGCCDIYDWNTRIIRVDKFNDHISKTLHDAHQEDNDIYDGEADACLLGIELNDPIYRLTFTPAETSSVSGQHSDRPSFVVNFPAEAGLIDIPPPHRNYDRPLKGTPRPRTVPLLPLRNSGFQINPLVTRHKYKTKMEKPTITYASDAAASDSVPILSGIDYDDVEKCSSRFSPICFNLGDLPPTATDDETKYLTSSPDGSNVIVKLSRNQTDTDSTDYINIFELRVPLGTTADSLLAKPLDWDAVVMLNTQRFTTSVGVFNNEVLVHLKPKAASELSPLSHNPDMSFIVKGAQINPATLDSTISIVELYTSEAGNSKVALNYIHHVRAEEN